MPKRKARRIALLALIPLRLMADSAAGPWREFRRWKAVLGRGLAARRSDLAKASSLEGPKMRAQAITAAFWALCALSLSLAPIPDIDQALLHSPMSLLSKPCSEPAPFGPGSPAKKPAPAFAYSEYCSVSGCEGYEAPCDDGFLFSPRLSTSSATRFILAFAFLLLCSWSILTLIGLRVWSLKSSDAKLARIHARLARATSDLEALDGAHQKNERRARRLASMLSILIRRRRS